MADESDFTLVSYGKKPRTASAVQKKQKQTVEHEELQTVSRWRFKEFQQGLIPAIEDLIAECSNQDHPFIQRWLHVMTGSSRINRDSSFRSVADALNLKDIQDYRRFLLTAPNVDKYISFGKNDRSTTVQYAFKTRPRSKSLSNSSAQRLLVNASSVATTVENKSNNDDSNITSPPTEGSKRGDNQPLIIEDESKPEDGGDSITSINHGYKVCYGNNEDFHEMMTEFWPCIQEFMEREPDHDHTKQWDTWIKLGLTSSTDLSGIKTIMGIETFDQFYLFLRDSLALKPFYNISWDHKIIYQKHVQLTNVPHERTNQQTDPKPTTITEPTRIYQIRLMMDSDMEFCVFHKRVYIEITAWHIGENATSDNKWMQWRKWMFAGLKAIQPVHDIKRILGITNLHGYIQAMQPYTVFQQKFILYDAEGDTVKYSYNADNVTMTIPTSEDFEHFNSHFHIHVHQLSKALNDIQDKVDACEHTLKTFYLQKRSRFESVVNGIIENGINSFREAIAATLQEHVQYSQQHLQQQITETQQISLDTYQTTLKTMSKEMLQNVCGAADDAHQALTSHYNDMLDAFKEQLDKKQQEVASAKTPPPPMPNLIRNPHFPNAIPVSPYVRKPNPYDTPEADNTSRNAQTPANVPSSSQSMAAVVPHSTAVPTASSSLPPHMIGTEVPISTTQSTNGSYLRFHANQPTTRGYRAASHPIPHTVQTGLVSLPPVNHDQALKRAKIQFSGLGDIFVFYNQLMNAMEQFGIYLLPLMQVKYQQSLCPESYGGIPIDHHRKQVMAGTLYQKLQSSDFIPLEYTAMRNIINRYAEKNDGYDVLYAMLELVHPALQKDAVMCPPKSSECGDDIRLYAQKFDAWLRYETYANRPYSAREQINKFVNELSPAFAPAISRVRRLLDAWNHYDLTVPEVLKITALPNTIERFMNEEAGTNNAYIRKIHDTRKPRQKQPKVQPQPPPIDDNKQILHFLWM